MREIVHRLDDQRDFTEGQLIDIGVSIVRINVDIAAQRRWITDGRLNENSSRGPINMQEYDRLYAMAIRGWGEARTNAGVNIELPRPPSPPIQFGDININEYVNERRPVFERLGQVREEPDDDSLSIYASDNDEPFPLSRMSVLNPSSTFQPVQFEAPASPEEPVAGPSHQEEDAEERRLRRIAREQVEARRREEQRSSQFVKGRASEPPRSERSRSELNSNDGAPSQASFASYVSAPQQPHSAPLTGVTYPPMHERCPKNLARNDPNLVGMSEIYTRRPSPAKICPQCYGYHRLFHCTAFDRMGLQMRWYRALKMGVCLYCFRTGHSSFTCDNPGCCIRCGTRHNSKLCPNNRKNLDPTL